MQVMGLNQSRVPETPGVFGAGHHLDGMGVCEDPEEMGTEEFGRGRKRVQQGWGQGRAAGCAKPGKTAPSSPSTLRASLRTMDLWVPSWRPCGPQPRGDSSAGGSALQAVACPSTFQILSASHLFRPKGLLHSLTSEPCG